MIVSRFKAVLFDLDGTLLDTLDDLADAMNATLAELGYPQHSIDACRYLIGDGVENFATRALPPDHRDAKTVGLVMTNYRQQYARRWADKTHPYDGITQLLDGLSDAGVAMAVLSNKPHDFTRVILARFLSKWRFERAVGAREGVPIKPDPAAARQIAEQLKIAPADFLYLGDTNTDMQTAVAAGMYPVGALWGFRTAEELQASGAKALVEKPIDVLKLL
jgi:phosphoglycolate phosphatase